MRLALILLIAVFASSARAQPATVLSKTFQFDGTCTGGDMWDQWKVLNQDDPFVRPFHGTPITVIGYELTKTRHVDKRSFWRKLR